MKQRPIKTKKYREYQERFSKWLATIGMASSAQKYMPLHLRELFHYCEQRQITQVEQISPQVLRDYFTWLCMRKNMRRGGGLSKGYINKHLQALKKFSTYLWHTEKILLSVTIKRLVENDRQKIEVLTEAEIASLYDAAGNGSILELRDQAILDLFYSCGLRRTEGRMLDIADVDLDLRRLHVRHGKNYTQRYVPFTKMVAQRLSAYQTTCRLDLIDRQDQKAFLISMRGNRMEGMSILLRVKKLQHRSSMESLKSKSIGLHTLRHSIATHLLHRGVKLQQIAQFMGHASIESTQIYTHLIHEL